MFILGSIIYEKVKNNVVIELLTEEYNKNKKATQQKVYMAVPMG